MKEIIKEREVVKGSDDRNVGPTEDSDHEEEIREEDFLEVILAKENLSEEEKMSIVLDILLGGYETTATLMGLIVYFISHAPLVFQKLKVPFFVSFPPSKIVLVRMSIYTHVCVSIYYIISLITAKLWE